MPPEEVAAGIAEAAMNSYRLANGMFADFVYVDRELGHRVWNTYGVHAIRFADWFLRTRYTSSIALVRDIVVLSQTPEHIPPKGVQPPVMFALGGATASVPTQTPPAAPVATTEAKPAETAPVETPASVEVSEPVTPESEGRRYELTTVDKHLHLERPRMADSPEVSLAIPEPGSVADDRRMLLSEEWKRLFRQDWPGSHG